MKKQFRTPLLVLLLLVLLLSIAGGISQVNAKYVRTFNLTGTLQIKTKLADDVLVQEHKATRQSDGSYKLSETELVKENSYTLIPGLDIPKDPFVTVTGKTSIDAFLFLEVVNNTGSDAISYTVDTTHWKKTEIPPKNPNGTVYLHIIDGETAVLDEATASPYTVPILAGKTVEIKQGLLSSKPTGDPLKFYVYLIEKTTASATPEQAYKGYK